MSWMAKLYQTYEVGLGLDLPDGATLMPVSHTMQNAHINIVIDIEGRFKRAAVLEKTKIVLPATEKAAGRTSGEAPYPLADKIQYVAKDYPDFGGRKKSYFSGYKQQLDDWCNSEFYHPKIAAIKNYISKGTVVADLISAKILYVDENRNLLADWVGDEKPLIFRVLPPLPKSKRINKDSFVKSRILKFSSL